MLTLTPIYAGLAGLFYVFLSLNVSLRRRELRLSIGDAGDSKLATRIRQHGNFAEYAPITLILLAACELQGAPALAVHLGGLALLASRLLHWYGMGNPTGYPARLWGMTICYLLISLLSAYVLVLSAV